MRRHTLLSLVTTLALIAGKDSGIVKGDLKSLKGKKIATSFGTINHLYVLAVLEKAGLTLWHGGLLGAGHHKSEVAEQQARARKLLTGTSIAREAARDGWFPGLWDFAAEQGRIPAAAQVPALRKRAIESHQIVLDSQNHPMVGKLARSMVTRYARIEAEVAA